MSPAIDYRQHLEVETPEHVTIDYEIAGLGSRGLAAIADLGLVVALCTVLIWAASFVTPVAAPIFLPIAVLGLFAIFWGYFILFEALREGQTPGKRWLGIRVIRDTGHPIGGREAVARNLLRLADLLPPPYLLGALLVAFHPKGKRLGDLVAGTVVVRDRPMESPEGEHALRTAAPDDAPEAEFATGAPLLSDSEYRMLREFGARAPALPDAVRSRFARQLVERVADRFPARESDDRAFLAALLRDEGARRRGRFGARSSSSQSRPGGPRAAGTASSVMERLVARKGTRWTEFGVLAQRATSHGLDSLGAGELPGFAARYREVASDLARARTYGAAPLERVPLERLVAAGHNLLYRDTRMSWGGVTRLIAVEAPAAVVFAWRQVLVAFLAFALPALGGFAALRERPALAEQVLPAVMLERAEQGAAQPPGHRWYVEVDGRARAFVASNIITNNIGVAFACFAGGIFLGVGSLVSLAYNGLQIGAVSGHYANSGLLGYLWTFVIGHGVLELFAIWFAGGAGLLLGMAIVRPGPWTRRDALVLNARVAMRMVACVLVLLLVAGSIEGFVSTSTAPLAVRLGVSITSAVLLVAYLANGARFRNEVGTDRPGVASLHR